MLEPTKQIKTALIVNGILALLMALGLLALLFLNPAFTIRLLTVLLAAYLLVEGLLGIWLGYRNRYWTYMGAGVISALLALALFIWPGLTFAGLVLAAAFWLIAIGIGRLLDAFLLRVRWSGRGWMALNGSLTLLLGILLLMSPLAGLVSLVMLLALYFLLSGIFLLAYAGSLREQKDVPM